MHSGGRPDPGGAAAGGGGALPAGCGAPGGQGAGAVCCGGHGLHWPQGEYPWAISSSRLPEKAWRFSSFMEAAPEQEGR